MIEVKFHDIGEGMTEGEVVRYFVSKGDHVEIDEPLVELQTDKMVAELPSPAEGMIQSIHVEEGTVVSVGTVLLEIESVMDNTSPVSNITEPSERHTLENDISPGMTLQSPVGVAEADAPADIKKPPKRIKAAPYTRKVAREHDVDIEKVEGTGPGGRVIIEDIHRFKESVSLSEPVTQMDVKIEETSTTIPFTGIRKQIAQKMTRSVETIPHVTHYDEIDLTNLSIIRNRLKDHGESISMAAFFVKTLALTLQDFPVLNGELDEKNDVIHAYNYYNIGLATDTERGLLVPVLKHVEQKSIRMIHAEIKELTKKAQSGELALEEMQGATFTMSNVGPLGGTAATPIINHPQTSIIAFHKTKKMPVVMDDNEIKIRSIMTLSMSFDHRVCDGAMAIRFTNRFSEWMENPEQLLIEMK